MKIKSFILAAMAAVVSLISCEELMDLGTPEITISEETLNFEIAGGEQEITLKATRDWKVEMDEAAAQWLEVSPENGVGSTMDQKVVVKAFENPGATRSASIKFTIGPMGTKTLIVSQTGEQGGEVPPVVDGDYTPISTVLATSGTFEEGTIIKGYVISNMDLNNLTSKKGMYVQDATGGLQFYLSANHTFAFGDEVEIDLSGAQMGAYNGAKQISSMAVEKITKLSSGNKIEAKTVTMADFLANKYEGQYVALEGVQVKSSYLSKTWGDSSNHTSIGMEDADGNSFLVFSSKYSKYGTQTVAQGSGTIKGIASINNNNLQIIFAQESDFAGLTGARFTPAGGGEVTPPAVSGEGTEANPYSASEAMAVAAAMSDGDERANVYVKGKVAQIKEAYSEQYGNVSYYITNDGTAVDTKQMFLVYRCKYFNGEKFTSEDQLKVGDEVIVVGTMVNFYGNTPELKNCHIAKLNGSSAPGTSGGEVTPPAASGEGTEANPYSASEAMAVAAAMAQDDVRENVYVKGKVADFKENFNAQYGNMSYYLTDDGVAVDVKQMFLVYRGKYFNGEKFTSADQLKVGDEVVVVGSLQNFYGNTPELLAGNKLVSINGSGNAGSGDTPAPTPGETLEVTVEQFLDAAVSSEVLYKVKGTVSVIEEINTQYGNVTFTISDSTGSLYVYRMKEDTDKNIDELGITVGDEIVIVGNRGEFNGNAQMINGKYVSHVDKEAPADDYKASIVFSDKGYTNAQVVKDQEIKIDDNVSCVFKKGTASTDPAYYNSGSAIRLYQGGAILEITASAGKTIKKIEMSFGSNMYYLDADSGSLSAEGPVRTWTGSANSVKFTCNGADKNHRAYVASIKVAYE